MDTEIQVLLITAASIGFIHTFLGPDHYVPFLVLSKAREWSLAKTVGLTLLCGLGHVLSSVLLGVLGITLQWELDSLVEFESFRGNIAAWALIAFGFLYALWGLRFWYRKRSGRHTGHHHHHQKAGVTPWVLFLIFVLGPCEPLIPILMYPAANSSLFTLLLVSGVFCLVTLATMVAMVVLPRFALGRLNMDKLSHLSHVMAGGTIMLSGLAIQFLGL